MMAGQDRISYMPDDVIRHILSFLDMTYVVKTSALSKKWKYIWTTEPDISLCTSMVSGLKKFDEFAKQTFSPRNEYNPASSVELTYAGAVPKRVKNIADYAYRCSTSKLTIKLFTYKSIEIPQSLFSSTTLKHLSLSFNDKYVGCRIQNLDWDLPSLETLHLTNLQILNASGKTVSLFAKCVALKDLTLVWMNLCGIYIFQICAPRLSNLTIKQPHAYSKVLNVASPMLKNLTASVMARDILKLSTDGFNCLQNVNLFMSFGYEEKRHVPGLLGLLQQLRNTKCLILDLNIVELLSSSMDVCSNKPCPFEDLKWLKINGLKREQNDHKDVATMATQVKHYLLQNSPNATFTMDLPKVSVKRSRELVDYDKKAKKVAKLE